MATAASSLARLGAALVTSAIVCGALFAAEAQQQQPAPGVPAQAPAAPALPPAGTLAQVMRGILFPSSNLIFNVQRHDPGAPLPQRPASQSPDAGFSWVDWGAGIYSGWELVDYAAVALAESAALMLTPGRLCENGNPVPVGDPEWVRFTMELAEAGRAAYKASQTRNQETVSEVTEQLALSCSHCHGVYRDRRGRRTAGDPANQSGRCIPSTR